MPFGAAAGDAPLSFNSAVDAILAAEAPEPQAAGEAAPDPAAVAGEASEPGAAPEQLADEQHEDPDALPPGEDDVEADAAVDGEEQEEQEPSAAVNAPAWWTAEDRALWPTLSPEVQAVVARQEQLREKALGKLKQEAAEERNRAAAETKGMGELRSRLATVAERAEQVFADRWPDNIDWVAVANEYGAEEATKLRFQHDQDKADRDQAKAAAATAETVEHRAFVQKEMAALATIEPELADPKAGPARRAKVQQFLQGLGVPQEQLRWASAVEFALAYDAMRYRDAKATMASGRKGALPTLDATAQPSPVKPRTPAPRPVAPAAAAQVRSPQQRQAQSARGRFHQKPSLDNAAAAILAMGG